MSTRLVGAVALLSIVLAPPATKAADRRSTGREAARVGAVSGRWQTIDDRTGQPRALISIHVENGGLSGRIERLYLRPDEGPDPICTRCKGELKNRRVVGMDILEGFVRAGARYRDGRILDPRSGKVHRGALWLDSPRSLKVRGYSGLFHRTETWRRYGPAPDPNSPVGVWETLDRKRGVATSRVAVCEEGGKLYGRVAAILLQPDEGADPICSACRGWRHGLKVVGMEILWGFRPLADKWVGGRVLDPENGKEYRGKVWLENPDTLRLRGYRGPFHRTQTWRRAEPASESHPATRDQPSGAEEERQ